MKYSEKRKTGSRGMAGHVTEHNHSLFAHKQAESKLHAMKTSGCKTCGKRKK